MSESDSKELSPGKVLKALREERNLTLDDVFQKTRITAKKLAWIESDAFSQLEAPVFVRGYIRSYARVVGGDANNLVRLYDQMISDSDDVPVEETGANPELRAPAQIAISNFSKSFINKTSIWSVVGVLAALWLVTMLMFGGDDDTTSPEAPIAMNHAVAEEVVPAVDTENGVSLAEQPEPANSSPAYERETGQVSEEPAVPQEEASPSPIQTEFVASQTSSSDEQNFLGFQFSDECWVEVRDAFDKVIFADLKNKGDNLRLSGVAPFNIMLGNARATELTIDGEPVELRVSGSRKTLRLTVFAK